jgi:hypothetical protein
LRPDEFANLTWPGPWHPVTGSDRERLEAELRRELCPGHILYGLPVLAVGRRYDQDNGLYIVATQPPSLAVVHLTYSVETDPAWPGCTRYDSIEEWLCACRAESP